LAAQGFQYDRMMDAALRGVMRDALAHAAERGLPGDHHFYITFQTAHPGVQVPATLRQRFPREMTIVLQFQFWGLEVGDAGFSVTLSFDAKHERRAHRQARRLPQEIVATRDRPRGRRDAARKQRTGADASGRQRWPSFPIAS